MTYGTNLLSMTSLENLEAIKAMCIKTAFAPKLFDTFIDPIGFFDHKHRNDAINFGDLISEIIERKTLKEMNE